MISSTLSMSDMRPVLMFSSASTQVEGSLNLRQFELCRLQDILLFQEIGLSPVCLAISLSWYPFDFISFTCSSI